MKFTDFQQSSKSNFKGNGQRDKSYLCAAFEKAKYHLKRKQNRSLWV